MNGRGDRGRSRQVVLGCSGSSLRLRVATDGLSKGSLPRYLEKDLAVNGEDEEDGDNNFNDDEGGIAPTTLVFGVPTEVAMPSLLASSIG